LELRDGIIVALNHTIFVVAIIYTKFHFPYGRGVNSIIASEFCLFHALIGESVRILEAANGEELLCCRFVVFLGVGCIHFCQGAGIDSRQAGKLIAFLNVGNITRQGLAEGIVTKSESLFIIVSVVEGFRTIGKVIFRLDPQFCHELSKVRLRTFRVNVEHLFAVLVGR